MPDAARLIAALCMSGLGCVVSLLLMPLMPKPTDFGYFVYINGAIGLWAGWAVMGKRVGQGLTSAINTGVGGGLALVFWGLFVHAGIEMFDRAMANRYHDVFDALQAVAFLMGEFGLLLINPLVISTLITGSILAGLLTELAGRKWR
ncbi:MULTISPECIES: TrgA family protein [Roseobacteraceae]|uniref:TrgA family protein n=1 Tax=Roseobacteraceae TaxID=2854170 RepID=UPI00329A53B8